MARSGHERACVSSATEDFSNAVTENIVVTKYFWSMDPSVHFLLGHDEPTSEGATIHALPTEAPAAIDENKIGFTLDVTVRLAQESDDDLPRAEIVPISEAEPEQLADSA
jgi:hypothetical protein